RRRLEASLAQVRATKEDDQRHAGRRAACRLAPSAARSCLRGPQSAHVRPPAQRRPGGRRGPLRARRRDDPLRRVGPPLVVRGLVAPRDDPRLPRDLLLPAHGALPHRPALPRLRQEHAARLAGVARAGAALTAPLRVAGRMPSGPFLAIAPGTFPGGFDHAPPGGVCFSTFLFARDARGRILLGRYREDARWTSLVGLDAARVQRYAQGWTIPASHVKLGEHP